MGSEKAIQKAQQESKRIERRIEVALESLLSETNGPISVSMLAKRASVSRGTIYKYKHIFAKLEELREKEHQKKEAIALSKKEG